jgi:hypothetical protein
MATATRIYHVNLEGNQFLVRASHPNAALMHVARSVSAVRVASQDDLVNCLADGIKVESAKEEAAPEPAPAPAEDKSLPLWPMPTPASSGFTDPQKAPLPKAEDDDEDDQGPPPRGLMSTRGKPAKYRDELTGSTWSGRGLQPIWLRVALAGGKKLSDFEVKTETAQA